MDAENRTASSDTSSATQIPDSGSPHNKNTVSPEPRPRARFPDGATDEKIEDAKPSHGDSERHILQMDECYDELGFGFTERKKWTILTIIFLVQVSM